MSTRWICHFCKDQPFAIAGPFRLTTRGFLSHIEKLHILYRSEQRTLNLHMTTDHQCATAYTLNITNTIVVVAESAWTAWTFASLQNDLVWHHSLHTSAGGRLSSRIWFSHRLSARPGRRFRDESWRNSVWIVPNTLRRAVWLQFLRALIFFILKQISNYNSDFSNWDNSAHCVKVSVDALVFGRWNSYKFWRESIALWFRNRATYM